MITTEAWVLEAGPRTGRGPATPGELKLESWSFAEPTGTEVLAEPIYGSWEGNMTHALERSPVDVCRLRREKQVILGNAGVVRVVAVGDAVSTVQPGDFCLFVAIGQVDRWGFMDTVVGYDEPGSMGLLARQVKLRQDQLVPLPVRDAATLQRWAPFSIRYFTAWANWQAAYGCWRVMLPQEPAPFVWGWGGGTSFAELDLARRHGCPAAMVCSTDARARLLERHGITPVDRREFPDLAWSDEADADPTWKSRYRRSEGAFLKRVEQLTGGRGVSIFLDYIGAPVHQATLKALGQPGILTTAGWKEGTDVSLRRATECMRRHVHVHTHAMQLHHLPEAVAYAQREDWLPPVDGEVWPWEEIPQLARAYAAGKVASYFPLFQVNAP